MSGIKFKGDTSGEILLETPAVAGTNTLTLPAKTGTLATTTEVNNVYNHLGMRNLIINGDMRIAQRATSKTGMSTRGYYTVDRFEANLVGAGTWTQTQDTDVPTGEGFSKSLKMLCTTANATLASTDFLLLSTKLEGNNVQHLKYGTTSAEKLTLSFWIKSNKTGTYISELFNVDVSKQVSKAFTIDTADTWEKKTLTFDGDTLAGFDDDTNNSLQAQIWLSAGNHFSEGTLNTSWKDYVQENRAAGQVNLADAVDNYINLTGVQLEVGEEATPFEHVPYDLSLQRCKRYFQKLSYILGHGYGDVVLANFNPIVELRARPVFTVNTDTGALYYESAPWATVSSLTNASVANGHTNGGGGEIRVAGTFSVPPNGKLVVIGGWQINVDAEL